MKYIKNDINNNCFSDFTKTDNIFSNSLHEQEAKTNAFEELKTTAYSTSGSNIDFEKYVYRFQSNYDILRETDFGILNENNFNTIKYVHYFVAVLQNVILNNRVNISDSSSLPPLRFRWLEDNSALIEWIFQDFRIGFSIEPDIEESGWYLVSNHSLDEISASGILIFTELESLLIKLLNFALANS